MKIRLAENFRAVFYAPFYATQALGFYAREGVEVEFVTSAAPGNAIGGLLDGGIDVTWGGPMRVMKAHDADPDSPLVCFGEVVARDPFYLVGRQDLAAFRLADLAGLRFASVSEVPTPWMCLQHDLRRAGVDPQKLVRVADRTMAENLAALSAGRLDAVQLFEPFLAQALRAGGARILYAASSRGPCVYTSFIATRERVAAKRDGFAAMVRAIAHMQAWIVAHGGEGLATVTAPFFADVAPDLLADALRRYGDNQVWAVAPDMSQAGFARLAESFVSGGALSRPPNFDACVAPRLIDRP
jgi:NitT/TauT family transport system substrate-binding protein